MTSDAERLAVAERATPGEWIVERPKRSAGRGQGMRIIARVGGYVASVLSYSGKTFSQKEDDARHIALNSPPTIIADLREKQALRERAERAEADLAKQKGATDYWLAVNGKNLEEAPTLRAEVAVLREALNEAEDFISATHENFSNGEVDDDAGAVLKTIRAALSAKPEEPRHEGETDVG